MKKIIFISTRNPYSNRFSGDIIGSKKIINILKKNNVIDVVTLGDRKDFSQKDIFIFKKPFFFNKFLHALKSLMLLQPIQLGFFYSDEMKSFINDNAVNYDIIFFIIFDLVNIFLRIIMEKKLLKWETFIQITIIKHLKI